MKIITVKNNSIASSLGLKTGDRLLRINSKKVADEIDYKFRISEQEVLIELEISGKVDSFAIEKSIHVLLIIFIG